MTDLRVVQENQDKFLEEEVLRHVTITSVDKVIDTLSNWGRRSSIWPMTFGLACCAIEMICTATARFDISRFGAELFRASPRQADLMIVSGTVTKRMVPMIMRLYNQMPEPKYVISMGACATAGGPFKEGYNVVSGIDEFLPVDVYITGCPPTPQALLSGLIELQKKIDKQHYRATRWYHPDGSDEQSVPQLGPDLVDMRQIEQIKLRQQENIDPAEPQELPPYFPAFPVYQAEPEDAPAEEGAVKKKKKTVDPPVINQSMQTVLDAFPDVCVTTASTLLVPAEHLHRIVWKVKEMGLDYLNNLTSVDFEDCFEVVYNFSSSSQVDTELPGVTLVVRTDKENPQVPSLTPFWAGADFQEREVYDMMGIRFEGHPFLRRILMWEGFEGWPLRKNFLEPYYEAPAKMFPSRWREGSHEFAEKRNIWGRNVNYPKDWNPDDYVYNDDDPDMVALGGSDVAGDLLEINMGPHHPSTHGVFRMKMALDGEKVSRLVPIMGYLHRNHEKIGERNSWIMNFPYTDRLDYLTSMSNNHGYAIAVEKLAGIDVPERAEYLRVIMTELNRIASHLWAQGFLLNDLGAFFTPMLYAAQERELILDLFEMVSGARIMCNYMRFGGVAYDLPDEFYEPFDHLISDRLPRMIEELDQFLTTNELVMERTQNLGVISKEDAIAYSCSGPVLRASGVAYDVRKNHPYSIYDRFDFDLITQPRGDVYSRYLVRQAEMYESLKILKQARQGLPEGEIIAKKQWNMRVPAGQVYASVESPKGQLGFYLVSDGKGNPYRYHIRSGSFINLTALNKMCQGHNVADVVAILGSIDIVLGEVDR